MSREEIIKNNPIVSYLRGRGHQFWPKGKEIWTTCPLHDDSNPSLRINEEKKTWYCDPCQKGGSIIDLVVEMEGVSVAEAMKKLEDKSAPAPGPIDFPDDPPKKKTRKKDLKKIESYSYRDETGAERYRVIRYEGKTFRQAHKDGDGRWVWGMKGVRRLLYNLPEVMNSDLVWITEGERDCNSLMNLGIVATTNSGGAGKFLEAYVDHLEGKKIILCGDNDEPGQEHIESIRKMLAGKVKWIKQLRLPTGCKDIRDFIESAGDKVHKKIERLVSAAPTMEKGIDLPIYSVHELERQYIDLIKKVESGEAYLLDLGRWLPSFKTYRPLLPGETLTIVADTGQGKTAAAQNICRVAKPAKVLFFELELPGSLMLERQVGIETKLSGKDIWKSYKQGSRGPVSKFDHIYTCTQPKMTLGAMERLIVQSQLIIGRKPDIVVLDYIQLMKGEGTRYQRLSDVADGLKTLARITDTVIVVVSQVARPEDKKGDTTPPTLHSAKDSGNIENATGMLIALWRDSESDGKAYVKVLKCTKGISGRVIPCIMDKSLRIKEEIFYHQTELPANQGGN